MTFLSVTHHVCTYVRTYVLCEKRSSIQSLALMHSAINAFGEHHLSPYFSSQKMLSLHFSKASAATISASKLQVIHSQQG